MAHLFGFGICCQVTRPWGCPVLRADCERRGSDCSGTRRENAEGRGPAPLPVSAFANKQPARFRTRNPLCAAPAGSYPGPFATNSRVKVKLVLRSPDGEVLRPFVFVWPFQFRHLRWGSAILRQEYAKVFRHSELKMDPFSFSSLSFSYLHSSYRLLNWHVRRLLPRRYITR